MSIIYIDDKAVPLIDGGGGGGCFSADTLISTQTGTKFISEIEIGDFVWAFDEIGRPILSKVTETYYHLSDELYRITHETGYLDITLNHWVLKEDGSYQEAKDFKIGDSLLTFDDISSKILSIEYLKTDEVYNFKVSHYHSYIANNIRVHNGGGGGKGGGGKEDPNSLFSTDIIFLLIGLCEGPIYRINPLGPLDIEFNEGLIDDLLTSNKDIDEEKFYVLGNPGTIVQSPLPLFGNITFIPQRFSSPVQLKKGNLDGVPRAAVDKQNTSVVAATALKFYFIIDGLQKQNDKGDIKGSTISVKVTVYDITGNIEIASQGRTITGKTNQAFSFDIFIRIPANYVSDSGYRFTVEKTSADNDSSKVQETVTIHGWGELLETPLAYPRTALVGFGLKAFAEHKGGLPSMTNIVKGLIVKVPSNYNQPILENSEIDWRYIEVSDNDRSSYGYMQQKGGPGVVLFGSPIIYDGLWDGQFVYSWTQNPAWHVYDMLTNKTYGLGIPEDRIDKYSFYESAVYNDACDPNTGEYLGVTAAADGTYRYKPRTTKTSVSERLYGLPVGASIKERRFIFDGIISDRKKIIDAINIITLTSRAMLYYKAGKLYLYQDRPDDLPIAIFNETNILKDSFSISGIDEEELITGVDVTYIDTTNHYRAEVVRIDDPRALNERNGIENIISFQAEGVSRKSQAIRLAQYMIADKKYSRRKVSFKTSPHASDLRPGDVISVSQRSSSIAWGFGGLIFETPADQFTANIKLEHISAPAIPTTVFTANSKPLALRVASSRTGLVDTYMLSNSYSFTSTSNVSGGADIIELTIINRYNPTNKLFETFTSYGTNRLPHRLDVWTLGEIQDPADIYTSLSDKLFRVLDIKRDKDETVSLEATEYIAAVYEDSDTLINYDPLYYSDLFDPLKPPPPPNFNLTAIPKRDLDGSVYTDIIINAITDTSGYTNEIKTDFYYARPGNNFKLISNTTPQISRDIIKIHLDDINDITEGELATIYGKNGYSFELATSKLLVTSYNITDVDFIKANGNISFTVTGLDNLVDVNFGSSIHVLAVNDTFNFGGLKGTDRISIPINQKNIGGVGDAEGLLGFIGSDTRLVRYSANVVGYDLNTKQLKIDNDHSGSLTLSSLLPDPPFYISIPQIVDPRYFANNSLYVTGSHTEFVRTNVATTTTVSGSTFKQPIGVTALHKDFVQVFINNIHTDNFTLETGLDEKSNSQVAITLSTLPSTLVNVDIRVVANVYTAPVLERGDNIVWNAGNVFGITNTTFDIGDATYNAALTANGIFRVILDDNIKSNVSQVYAINITPNPVGTIGNLNVGQKTFTFDYASDNYPGLYNLGNNSVYIINSPSDSFTPLEFEPAASSRTITRVETGVHAVKARNINKYGRRSPFVTKQVNVRPIPIQAVRELTISEEIYKDSTIGVAVRIIISFLHITGQEVTDYEISYKLSGTAQGDLTSYNTILINAVGVDADGKVRVKIDNIEKGLSSNPNNIVVRVTPLNRNIRGSTVVTERALIGKSAAPLNVKNFTVGQAGSSLVFIWSYELNPLTGDNYDLDLMEVQIRRLYGTVTSDFIDLWPRSDPVAIIDARTNRVVVDIDQYGEFTYLVRTKDTSGNFSATVRASPYTSISQTFINVYRAYNEDSPDTNFITGYINDNLGELSFPSFANSNTGGVSYAKADSLFDASIVDNANGTSTGWSVISGSPTDLRAVDDAVYQTQIRDIGSRLTGTIYVNLQGDQSLVSTWLDFADTVGEPAVTEASTSGKIKDVDFSGALGLGNILGFANAGAATVTYGSENKTLVSGTSTGALPSNVYAIISPGNFSGNVRSISSITQASPGVVTTLTNHDISASGTTRMILHDIGGMTQLEGIEAYATRISDTTFGLYTDSLGTTPLNTSGYSTYTSGGVFDLGDYSNANSFSLIAGVENADTLVLGKSWHANGKLSASNGISNLTIAGSSYKLVNLRQWLDLSEQATFYGTTGIVTANLKIRTATNDPYYANGNVNVAVFTSDSTSDGFVGFVASPRTFRYFQFRYEINNSDPAQAEFLLDQFRYYVAVDERAYAVTSTVDTQIKYIDYSQMVFTQIPKVSATVAASSDQLGFPQAIILDRGLQGANISVYFANGLSAHDIVTPTGTSDIIYPQVDFAVTGV